jgi:hypothetical protein
VLWVRLGRRVRVARLVLLARRVLRVRRARRVVLALRVSRVFLVRRVLRVLLVLRDRLGRRAFRVLRVLRVLPGWGSITSGLLRRLMIFRLRVLMVTCIWWRLLRRRTAGFSTPRTRCGLMLVRCRVLWVLLGRRVLRVWLGLLARLGLRVLRG